MRGLSRVTGDEAGAGFRLEELERAHPVDDELDADDEDQEAMMRTIAPTPVAPSLSIQGVP